MPKASSEARKLWPYLLPLVERAVHATTIIQNGGGGTPGGGGSAPSPHDLFSSHHGGTLANAQAPQFLLLDGTRALEGNLAVDPGVTIDGVDISVHVANPDAHHVRVAAGDGTLVNVPLQQVAVDEAFDFNWTGTHTFNVDPQINANLDFIGGERSITGNSSLILAPFIDLKLQPTGVVSIPDMDTPIRTGLFADSALTGITGFNNDHLGGNVRYLRIGAIKTDNLYARYFTADEIRVTRGSEIWSRSYGIVEEDFIVPADEATVDVWFEEAPELEDAKLFLAGNWLVARLIDLDGPQILTQIFFQVVDADGAGTNDYIQREDAGATEDDKLSRQQWRLQRKFGGVTGQTVKKGATLVDLGVVGQGAVSLTALAENDGPYIQTEIFDSVVDDRPQYEAKTRMGNLKSTVDYAVDTFGFATGNNLGLLPSSGFSGMASDETNGLRLFNTDIALYDVADLVVKISKDDGIKLVHDTNLQDNEYTAITWHDNLAAPGDPYSTITSYVSVGGITFYSEANAGSGDGFLVLNAIGNNDTESSVISVQSANGISMTPNNGIVTIAGHIDSGVDAVNDLGTASSRYRTLYVDQVIADSVSGATISGAEWEHPGSMVIDANSASNTTVSVTNQGAGVADLDVDRNITLGGTVDGVDIAGHAGNAAAHHNPVTVGNTGLSLSTQVLSLALAATSGLQISSGLMLADTIAGAGLTIASKVLAVGAGSGITVNANDVALASSVAGAGLTYTTGVLAVGAGNGIAVAADAISVSVHGSGALDFSGSLLYVKEYHGLQRNANGISIDLDTNPGLAVDASGLRMGTPTTLTYATTNAVSGSGHAHAVSASSNVGAGTESLLKSTTGGGLTLASLTVMGAATVDEDLTAADTAFRVINHTHDFPHAHVVINPGGLWSLDEQFGLDIDDNLLVRGWIVGKHAIQVADAEMLVHFDGQPPVESNFTGNPTGHMGQVGVKSGGATFRAGRFGKALLTGETTTNLITNPSFEVNTTGWSTIGTVSAFERRNGPNTVGSFCARLAISDNFSGIASNSMTFTSGQSYTFSFDVMHVDGLQSNNWIARFRKGGTGVSTWLEFTPPDEWERVSFTWLCNATGSDYDLSIYINVNDFSRIVIDAVQVEEKAYATPYCDGSLGGGETETGHSWSGTAHASTSSRSASYVTYDDESLDDFGHPMTVMAWIKPTSSGSYQSIVSKEDSGSTLGWDLANSSGTLRASIRGGGGAVADIAAGTLTLDAWNFCTFTYNGSSLIIYLNGVQTGATSGAGTTVNTEPLRVGRRATGNVFNGLIDEVALIRRVLTADEIRAIYESNAPIFAETSTWHWRSGRNRIYADAEGLWGLGANYGEILGLYAGEDNNPSATKSWGGLALSEGDFLLGDADRGSYLLWDHSAANLTLGKTGANNAALTLSGTDISMVYNSVERMRIDSAGFVMKDTAGVTRVNLGSGGGLALNDSAGVARVLMQSDGTLAIRNSSAQPVFTFNASAGAEFTLPLTLGSAGGIYQGTGTFGSPTTGLKIWNDGTAATGKGRITGYNAGVVQWEANTNGKLVAGGGDVVLDADGIQIVAAETNSTINGFQDQQAIVWEKSGNAFASIVGEDDIGFLVGRLVLSAKSGIAGDGEVYLQAINSSNSAFTSTLSLDSDGGIHANVHTTDGFVVSGRLEAQQTSSTAAVPTLTLTQSDNSEGFINFTGNNSSAGPIHMGAAIGAYAGKIRVEINGTVYAMPIHAWT